MSDKPLHNKLNDPDLKKNVFKAPEGYFESLQDKIMLEAKLKNGKVLSNQHLRKNIFSTPEGYFNTLTDKINAATETEAKVIPMYRTNWFRYAAAAVVLVMAALFAIPKNNPSESELMGSLSNEAIIDYLEERQAMEYELLSSVSGLDAVLDNMILEETAGLNFAMNENPELDYDFEYLDY